MDKKEISKKFGKVQEILESLQQTGATCLFIGHEGNHFVISGDITSLKAQLLFSMMHYPVVEDIIKTCAERFDEMSREHAAGVRNVKMEHLIEHGSGNKEN